MKSGLEKLTGGVPFLRLDVYLLVILYSVLLKVRL